jgi:hypothetical protein
MNGSFMTSGDLNGSFMTFGAGVGRQGWKVPGFPPVRTVGGGG